MFAFTLLVACNSDSTSPTPTPSIDPYVYQTPIQTDDNWKTGTLAEVGLKTDRIEALVQSIQNGQYPVIDGIVLIKENKLVFEHYFNGYNKESRHEMQSATKSIDSALVGLAKDLGYISHLDQTIHSLLDYPAGIDWSDHKDEITLHDLLTMRSGLNCTEGEGDGCSSQKLNQSFNWTHFTLEAEMRAEPGSEFSYFTGLNIIAHTIIEKLSGLSIDEFSRQFLFSPIGITDFKWLTSPAGEALQVHLRPRDMAKFGQLFLNKGNWNGVQVLSESWIEESTATHVTQTWGSDYNYGYWWWLSELTISGQVYSTYTALGANGQWILQIPDLGIVVVITGNKDSNAAWEIIEQYIHLQ